MILSDQGSTNCHQQRSNIRQRITTRSQIWKTRRGHCECATCTISAACSSCTEQANYKTIRVRPTSTKHHRHVSKINFTLSIYHLRTKTHTKTHSLSLSVSEWMSTTMSQSRPLWLKHLCCLNHSSTKKTPRKKCEYVIFVRVTNMISINIFLTVIHSTCCKSLHAAKYKTCTCLILRVWIHHPTVLLLLGKKKKVVSQLRV